jgi:membrane protease YdiL (CAAX protease family)
MVALFGVFVAPIAEEIAFRGFLYPALRPWTGRILGAILTSIPFAFLHAQQVAHAWGPLTMVFLVSLVLVAVRERTGSVAASALVHACYNLSIFAVIFYASGGFQHLDRLKD